MGIIYTSPTGTSFDDGVGLIPKELVLVATTSAGDLSLDFENGDVIDDVTLTTGDRILIKDQTNAAENGVYVVNASGAPTRADDFDIWDEVINAFVFVTNGTVNNGTGWMSFVDPLGSLETTPIPFTNITNINLGSFAAGTGLTLTGNVISLDTPVDVSLGGTGLSGLGAANQVLGVDALGTGAEYKTITGGIAIDVVDGIGSITIDNLGVTSLTGTPNEIDVSASTGAITLSLPSTINVSNINLSGVTPSSMLYVNSTGDLTSTTAPNDGEILIGSTGSDPVLATLTAGNGISITNAAGSITINSTSPAAIPLGSANQILGVDAAGIGSEYKSLIAGTNVTITHGANSITIDAVDTDTTYTAGTGLALTGTEFSITAPIPVNLGGTGLNSLGSGDQILGVDAAGTASEYKTLSGGTAIGITNTVGDITIDNLGVTSLTGTPNEIDVSASTGAVILSLPPTINVSNINLSGVTPSSMLYVDSTGDLTSTAAPTDGQILIGSTGSDPVLATLTAGMGISITNAAGSITINSTSPAAIPLGTANQILGVDGTGTGSEYKSLIAGANVTITHGANSITIDATDTDTTYTAGSGLTLTGTEFSITAPIPINLGGTGQSSLGSGDQILGMNATGTATEYKSVTSGTAIGITNTAGDIKIDNLGVTSLTGTPNEIDVSSSTGSITLSLPPTINVSNINLSGVTPSSMLYVNSAGDLTSTAAPTDGQILIGSTGSDPVLATLTAGNGISITNAAGTITIDSTSPAAIPLGTANQILGVDAAGSGSEYKSLIAGTNVTITHGANSITIDATDTDTTYTAGTGLSLVGTQFSLVTPIPVNLGGTGQTSLGLPNEVLGMNAAGTATEYKTIGAGTGISVTDGLGLISITNTGVTSLTGTPNEIDVSSSTGAVTLSLPPTINVANINLSGVTPSSMLFVDASGDLTSTTAPTDGQILIGSTGNDPVLSTLTAGANITITNTPGNITIASTQATFTAGAGLSLIGNEFSITAPIPVNLGGTGTTSFGTSNQIFGVNSAGNATEYKTLTAGTAIGITHSAGDITVDNLGVTSLTGTPNEIDISASTGAITLSLPSTINVSNINLSGVTPSSMLYVNSSGDLTSTAAPTDGQILIGSTGSDPVLSTLTAGTGISIVNSAGAITIASTASGGLDLVKENSVSPVTPIATGNNSVSVGSGSQAQADDSFANGEGALAHTSGMKAYANGQFAKPGDAQHGVYVARGNITSNNYTEIFLDGVSQQFIIPDNTSVAFSILFSGAQSNGTLNSAGIRIDGIVNKDSTPGSIFMAGNGKMILGRTQSRFNAKVDVDTTTGALRLFARADTGIDMQYVAVINTSESAV